VSAGARGPDAAVCLARCRGGAEESGANPTCENRRATAGILERGAELGVVGQRRDVEDLPERRHVIALGAGRQRLVALEDVLRQIKFPACRVGSGTEDADQKHRQRHLLARTLHWISPSEDGGMNERGSCPFCGQNIGPRTARKAHFWLPLGRVSVEV